MKLTRQDYILAGGQALLWITLWLIPAQLQISVAYFCSIGLYFLV